MKGEKASEAIREMWIANTSVWVSGTPLSTAPQRLSPLSTCSSITCECKAKLAGDRSFAVTETEQKPFLENMYSFIYFIPRTAVSFCNLQRLCVDAMVLSTFSGKFPFYETSFCLFLVIFVT